MALAVGPRPDSEINAGEGRRAATRELRSVWGSGCIPGHHYLIDSQLERSTVNTILLINDHYDMIFTLRSCNFTVRTIALDHANSVGIFRGN